MPASSTKTQVAVDTLHMTKAQWLEVLGHLEREALSVAGANRRTEQRRRYRVLLGMLVDIIHPGGSRTTFRVRCRDLSPSGIGFLHGNFLHVGTRCTVTLPQRDGQSAQVGGKVVRCRHVQGKVHEIGVKFDKPLALDQFLPAP